MAFQLASRKKTFHLIGITGHSTSGKTYSALRFARGIVSKIGGTIGFIDTENGRGSMYSTELGPYMIDELHAPFSSPRYTEKMKEAAAQKFSVLIIDSFSHEWEGIGGVLEYADEIETKTKAKGLNKWNKPKVAHKKMMNVMTQLPMHVIVCLRAKDKKIQVKNADTGKDEILSAGTIPIQDKDFIYEMTLSFLMGEKYHVEYKKGPETLRPFFHDKIITEETGARFIEWANEGTSMSSAEQVEKEARHHANEGTPALMAYWKTLTVPQQKELKPKMEDIKLAAAEADKQAAMATEVVPEEEQQTEEERKANESVMRGTE